MQQTSTDPSTLTHQKCVPCEGGTAPMTDAEEDTYHDSVSEWQIDRTGIHQLKREFQFKNFKEVLGIVNKIGELAEAEGHHPNLYMYGYKNLRIELSTHAIGGLSMNDFILAAKINDIVIQSQK
jgi:4a-hydroxytetrahydrobiopterin dehydratase